jgi:dihydroflavonol-4-reductase
MALKRPGSGFGLLADVADQITWYDGDVTDIPSLEAAIGVGIDVVHAAAMVSFAPKDRDRMEKINVEGTANVVNVCLARAVRRLGFVSSVAALGRPESKQIASSAQHPIVIDGNQKWEDSPNNSFYAKTKYRAELEVWRGIGEGLDAVMVCPSIVLGAGNWSRSSTQLVKYAHDEHRFYPAGLCNYVDARDVANALTGLMHSPIAALPDAGEGGPLRRFILNGGTISYRGLLENMAQALGKRPPTTLLPPALTRWLWPLEGIRAWLTGQAPLITRETARSASQFYRFDGQAIAQVLDFQYRPLADTIQYATSGSRAV